MKYLLFLSLLTLANCRPQKSLYSKGITSYGTPISNSALNINLENLPIKNKLENSSNNGYNQNSPKPEIKPLSDEYKPVPQVSSLPLDKSALDRNDPNGKVGKKEALIHKHVYVHIPPPELNEGKNGKNPVVPEKQKHYKIIFIQAPTQKTPSYNLQTPQSEEKTLIYVLYKKPEQILDVPSSLAPPAITKPEVYFIKYKTKQDQPGSVEPSPPGAIGYPETPTNIINSLINPETNSFGSYQYNSNGDSSNNEKSSNDQQTSSGPSSTGIVGYPNFDNFQNPEIGNFGGYQYNSFNGDSSNGRNRVKDPSSVQLPSTGGVRYPETSSKSQNQEIGSSFGGYQHNSFNGGSSNNEKRNNDPQTSSGPSPTEAVGYSTNLGSSPTSVFGGYQYNSLNGGNSNNEIRTNDSSFDKVGKSTNLITGGSISDALLGAGTLPGAIVAETTTQESTTEILQTSSVYGLDPRTY